MKRWEVIDFGLFLGLIGTSALYWVAPDPGWFQVLISVTSFVCAFGIFVGHWDPDVRIDALWLSGGMWSGQVVEILTSNISGASKVRLGFVFAGYAYLAIHTYLTERRTRGRR